jgi:hypothetical protein
MPATFDHVLHSAAGRFDDSTDSKAADVARLLDLAARADKPNGLLLHFHGGLVRKKSGMDIAGRLAGIYGAAGAYPVFFVWESGLFESLLNNQDDVARDPAFQELVKKVSEWVLKKLSGPGVFKGGAGGQAVDVEALRREYDAWFDRQRPAPPVADGQVSAERVQTKGAAHEDVDDLATEIEEGFDDDPDFRKAMEEAYNAQLPTTEVATRGAGSKAKAGVMLLSESARAELFPRTPGGVATKGGVLSWFAVAKFVARTVVAVLKRHLRHRDHGAYCTIVEEVLRGAYGDLIGSTVWNQMKKDTGDSFQDGADFCGTEVVRQLKARQDAGQPFPRITLVGHSTGAIYICHFLDAAKAAGITTPIQVVFLAPALTHRLFAQALRDHGGSSRLQRFRLFGMTDGRESGDMMASVLYTRSLLYFVSGLLEGEAVDGQWRAEVDTPIGGMQRYLDEAVFQGEDFGDIQAVAAFLAADPERTVWSPSERGPGLNSDAKKHGGFDEDYLTLESLQAFIRG